MLHWDPDKRASAETMLNHPWLSMPANYNTKISQSEREQLQQKQRLAQESADPYESEACDAQVQYYHNAEMSKLTDSEAEYWPADDEHRLQGSKASTAAKSSNAEKLQSFLERLKDDSSDFFFSDDEDADLARRKNCKVQRNLAEGQNLNNSFGCYSPGDWEHLHVDKGPNP